jgi:hypothetical protein
MRFILGENNLRYKQSVHVCDPVARYILFPDYQSGLWFMETSFDKTMVLYCPLCGEKLKQVLFTDKKAYNKWVSFYDNSQWEDYEK